jgi:hypothetical protein
VINQECTARHGPVGQRSAAGALEHPLARWSNTTACPAAAGAPPQRRRDDGHRHGRVQRQDGCDARLLSAGWAACSMSGTVLHQETCSGGRWVSGMWWQGRHTAGNGVGNTAWHQRVTPRGALQLPPGRGGGHDVLQPAVPWPCLHRMRSYACMLAGAGTSHIQSRSHWRLAVLPQAPSPRTTWSSAGCGWRGS